MARSFGSTGGDWASGGRRALVAGAILLVLLIAWIWALANAVLVTQAWEFDDVHAYITAAQRLLDGQPLYISAKDMSDLYLYSPWFAIAWIPFAGLPVLVLEVAWAAILLIAFAACLWPYWRSWAGLALVLLLGGLLYRTVGWGNVQPLLLASLIHLIPTRAGPWMVGIAASIKPWPILAAAVYAWRRDWRSFAISTGVAALLWLPFLFFNWHDYPAGARPPNIYDATFLLVVPPLLGIRRVAPPWRARRGQGRSGSRATGEG